MQVGEAGKRFFFQATQPAVMKVAATRSSLLSIASLGSMLAEREEEEAGGAREGLMTLAEDGRVAVWTVDTVRLAAFLPSEPP